ncbi:hypothetical protein CCHR01_11689 [Colletotrichum chrysophilum]|uniref:Uncharacterized protein n=1 Tax=Colletotrichum chrysophilum TaxID=1836956 RepID=A0AAD9ACK9_9PEZI|nr:hypothetical protein CCHR01_11689 [Colletotrichum chrysophilum]
MDDSDDDNHDENHDDESDDDDTGSGDDDDDDSNNDEYRNHEEVWEPHRDQKPTQRLATESASSHVEIIVRKDLRDIPAREALQGLSVAHRSPYRQLRASELFGWSALPSRH